MGAKVGVGVGALAAAVTAPYWLSGGAIAGAVGVGLPAVGAGLGHLYDRYSASQAAKEEQRKALEDERIRKALEAEEERKRIAREKEKEKQKKSEKEKLSQEANQEKQRLETQQKRQAEKLRKEQSQHAKAGAAAKKRVEREKAHEEQLVREQRNKQEKQDRMEAAAQADEQRRAAIDDAVTTFLQENRLNNRKAMDIARAAKDKPTGNAQRVRQKLEEAMAAQMNPSIAQWRSQLRMEKYEVVEGWTFSEDNPRPIHITFDQHSVEHPGSMENRDANQLIRSLLRVEPFLYRIHATLEGEVAPNQHYYYGNGQGIMATAVYDRLSEVLDEYVTGRLLPRVQEAVDLAGDFY